jgi:hypothetical protein
MTERYDGDDDVAETASPANDAAARMTRLEYALHLAFLGFWLFPVKRRRKTPAITGWQNRATRHEATLREWFEDNMYAIGISTSKFGDDGALLVVDVDQKPDRDGRQSLLALKAEGFELPTTRTHRSPSGGVHMVYKVAAPVKGSVDKIGPGLDIRSKGNLIVAYHDGSTDYVLNNGPVADAPTWLIELCGKASDKPKSDKPAPDSTTDAALKGATDYLRDAAPLVDEI